MRIIIILVLTTILLSSCSSVKNVSVEESQKDKVKAVWISHPSAEQCGEVFYADMSAAVSFLKENKIEALNKEEVKLMTCSACGCPSSLHFAVEINNSMLKKAQSLGWKLYEKEE